MRDGGSVEFGVRITADNQVFLNGVKAAQGELGKLGDSIKQTGTAADQATGSQENLTAAVFKGVLSFEALRKGLGLVVDSYREVRDASLEMQRGQAQLEAVLKATGGAAGQTSGSINALVDNLAKVTRFTDSDLKQAATNILTFNQVSGDSFKRILGLSADLAATGRGSLEQWSVVLSRAAQAPAESIGLLERYFGKFDSTLKVAIDDAIHFGKTQEAQTLLFDEVARRVGGTAVGAYRGLELQLGSTEKSWLKFKQTVGEEIFSANSKDVSEFAKAINFLTGKVHSFAETLKSLPGLLAPLSFTAALINAAMIASRANDRNNFASGQIAPFVPLQPAQPKPGDALMTFELRQKLREQDITAHGQYLARLFANQATETHREMDILEFQHTAGLVSEEDYIGRKEKLREEEANNEVGRIKRAIDTENSILSIAYKARKDALASPNDPNQQARLFGAEMAIVTAKGKIADLTNQEAEATKKIGDARRQQGQDETILANARRDALITITRDGDDYTLGLTKQTDEMRAQLGLIGQDELAIRLANNERKIALDLDTKLRAIAREIDDLLKKSPEARDTARIDALLAEMDRLKGAAAQAISDQAALIKQTYSAEFFATLSHDLADALITGGKDAGGKIRDILEAALKKPFTLFLQASIQGLLGQMFGGAAGGSAGGGTLGLLNTASNLYGGYSALSGGLSGTWGSAISSAGNFLGSETLQGFGLGMEAAGTAGGAEAATAVGGAAGSAGLAAAEWIPYIGWAIAAYELISTLSQDPGPARRTASVGTSPTGQYQRAGSATSPFGTFGVFGDHWFDDSSQLQPIQRWLGGESQFETAISHRLTPEETARVTGALNVPHQYNFGMENDPNGTAGALGAITIDRVKTIFNAIDPALGKLLDDFKGTGEQLIQFAANLLDIRDALKQINVTGLDVTTLGMLGKPGESIEQTFSRVGSEWSFFVQNFTTSSDALSVAQHNVAAAFTDLGITAPTTTAGFASLVHGLDLSTDAGRHMFDVLMGIAPAFLNVTNAAAQAQVQMDSLAQGFMQAAINMHGGAGGALGQGYARANLEGAAQHWLDLVGNDAGHQTVSTVIGNVPNVDPNAALAFARSFGPEAVQALTDLFNAYGQWQSALSSGVQSFTPAIQSFTGGLTAAQQELLNFQHAQASLGDWLKGLALDQNLSPLSPMEKLGLAQSDWEKTLTAAQGGDATAAGKLQGSSQTYLDLAQQLFAHGPQFVDIFNRVFNADAAIAGVPDLNTRLASVLPQNGKLPTSGDITQLGSAIGGYLQAVADRNDAAIANMRDAITRSLGAIADTVGRR
jgi:hypothetical protein